MKASVGYVLGAFLRDMDFFYHLLAIVSRYTVFVKRREDEARAERQKSLAACSRTSPSRCPPCSSTRPDARLDGRVARRADSR